MSLLSAAHHHCCHGNPCAWLALSPSSSPWASLHLTGFFHVLTKTISACFALLSATINETGEAHMLAQMLWLQSPKADSTSSSWTSVAKSGQPCQISCKSAQLLLVTMLLAGELLACVFSEHTLTKAAEQLTSNLCPILLLVGQKISEDLECLSLQEECDTDSHLLWRPALSLGGKPYLSEISARWPFLSVCQELQRALLKVLRWHYRCRYQLWVALCASIFARCRSKQRAHFSPLLHHTWCTDSIRQVGGGPCYKCSHFHPSQEDTRKN